MLLVRRAVREKRFLRNEKEESSDGGLVSVALSSAPASPAATNMPSRNAIATAPKFAVHDATGGRIVV